MAPFAQLAALRSQPSRAPLPGQPRWSKHFQVGARSFWEGSGEVSGEGPRGSKMLPREGSGAKNISFLMVLDLFPVGMSALIPPG